jgi:hypothetical protein
MVSFAACTNNETTEAETPIEEAPVVEEPAMDDTTMNVEVPTDATNAVEGTEAAPAATK